MSELGKCCACRSSKNVRNVMMLHQKAPIAGTGWGCVVCNLPNDGAVAVLCDACFEAGKGPIYACKGYPAADRRIRITKLTGEHEHNQKLHEEFD